MHYLIPLMLVLGTVAFMEWFAAWSHEHIMHGWGWNWHKSHHEPHDGWFEKNDLYAVVFTVFAIALFAAANWFWPLRWIAVGLTTYGVLYFFMHDGLVHQRWPFKYVPRTGYLKRIYQAHRLHHAVKGRDGCVSFGFIYAEPAAQLKKKLQDRTQDAPGARDQRQCSSGL
ncbi:sterol desaturase family protein [Massilia sp. IC2-477]|uniref:sterol desaturase family protein n=1 Tax=Massilia sp. IC2-477 TaxID=2887198 RepID=UPI001D12F4B1|nr:sterol desaturase family protein [Massilia sp. IC2-477]MCC2956568.1 sterol desaturase family protein [Massilia sp. IC2-477]